MSNQYLSSFFLRKARLPLSTPATASSNPFGIITASELPTFLIRPLRTLDIIELL